MMIVETPGAAFLFPEKVFPNLTVRMHCCGQNMPGKKARQQEMRTLAQNHGSGFQWVDKLYQQIYMYIYIYIYLYIYIYRLSL